MVRGCPFLPQALTRPTQNCYKTVRFKCSPSGILMLIGVFELDRNRMALRVYSTTALSILHKACLVVWYTRIFGSQILCAFQRRISCSSTLNPQHIFLSKWKMNFSASWARFRILYVPFSDMYSLGKLLKGALPEWTSFAERLYQETQ